ncbi:MAG: hypothetical protein PHI40_03780 [Caldisericia bacterium]|nr:hypothetical protein [Caldisericia bacterium]MDD4614514.1 hypothetical protein [Caldisericia bacterium]
MDKLSLLKKFRIVILAMVLLYQSPISTSAQYNPHKMSHHVVESFGSTTLLGMVVPLHRVEKEWNYRVDGIYYLVDELNEYRKILPNEYGLMRWKYLKQKLDISHNGLTLHIVDHHSQFAGRGEGSTFEQKQQSLVEQISDRLTQSTSTLHMAETKVTIEQSSDQHEMQVTFRINWETIPDTDTLARLKYSLFLVADEIYMEQRCCMPEQTLENVAYTFIPFEGDDLETFDGSGFLLDSPNHKIHSENPIGTLTTVPFILPEIPGNRNNGWSLHLMIEDPENLGKEIFSSKIRLNNM